MCFQQSLVLIISLMQFYVNDVLAYASHYTPEGIEAQLKKYKIVPDIMENATKEAIEVCSLRVLLHEVQKRNLMEVLQERFGKNVSYTAHQRKPIKAQLKKYRIVPDIMENATKEALEVEYQGNLMIQMGNFVPLNRTAFEPKIKWKVDPNFYYTITLLDADYINIMVLQKVQYQLWMILNIPGDNITAGELLTEYMGPNPEKDDRPYHRFVFVLWQHPFVNFRELRVRGGQLPIYRENFNAKKFTEKYEEDGLGEPYAVNFFRTHHPKEE